MPRERRDARRALAGRAAAGALYDARRPRPLSGAPTERCDLAIVGGGAAGLAAAIFAADAPAASPSATHGPGTRRRVVVLDGAPRLGAKILIAGGGRCNVTHDVIRPEDFNGTRPVVRNVLAAFDAGATVRWFTSLGVALKREATGKLFPTTDRAQTVLDALLRRCAALAIDVRPAHRVTDVVPADGGTGWHVEHERGVLAARLVVLATGGRSLPRSGSDGAGWTIATRLGHGLTTTVPALVPLVLRPGIPRELSGVSQPVELRTSVGGKLVDRRTGSMLWTHVGVSGPVVLDASRHWTLARAKGADAAMQCSFFPGESFEDVERRLLDAARSRPRTSIARLLAAGLPERVGIALARDAGLDPAARLAETARAQRRALVHRLTGLALPIERDRGWDHAEVTAGGVPLAEIDYRTMASRLRPGLFLIGEMLDCDGRIGGFNFQWAWATGFLAGRAAAAALADIRPAM